VSDLTRSKWYRLKETISLLGSVYSVVLLIGLFVSIIIQILPILKHTTYVEVAKYSMVIFASVLISYIALKHTESRIFNTITKENSELCRYLASLSRTIAYDDKISQYLISLALISRKGKLEDFDYAIKQMKKRQEELQRLESARDKYPMLHTLPTHDNVGMVIEISSHWQIPFRELASHLYSKLGKEHAKRLVKLEKILKCYGEKEVSMWKSIIE